MRTASAGMTAHLATRSHSRCWMMRMDLADGSRLGFTGHDKAITFDLSDGAGEIAYSARTGILPSNVAQSANLDADNFEVEVPISEALTQQMLLGGRFDMARVFLFQICWRRRDYQALKILAGDVTDIRQEGGRCFLEVRSDFHRYNQVVGRQITTECIWDYGDDNCGATVEYEDVTLTGVTSDLEFAVTDISGYADGYFDFGTIEWQTGDLAGSRDDDVFAMTAAGAIELFDPAVDVPQVGDTARLKRGCPKNRPGCMARGRMKFYGGYPDTPGNEKIMRAAIPGDGDQ